MDARTWPRMLGVALLLATCAVVAGPAAGVARQDATPEGQIGEEEARAIAQEAYPDAEVTGIESEEEGGRLVYEVEFADGAEVSVDATTGEVVETEGADDGEDEENDEGETEDDEDDEGEDDDDDGEEEDDNGERAFMDTFYLDGCAWSSTRGNPYFSLAPGFQAVLQGEDEGEPAETVITVLDETETVGGIETRVLEERETVGGELVEVSRNFFALCTQTGSVFYFGETVEDYEDGQVVANEGAWRADEGENRPGLIMPGEPVLGARYYTEIAPEVALDRTEIIEVGVLAEVPAGTFENCFRAVDSTPLEPGVEDPKTYCPEVGVVHDEGLELVSAGPAATPTA